MSCRKSLPPAERAARNAALQAAELQRQRATHDAEVEYSETVRKLRDRFETDMAEAARVRLEQVAPAHVAYNVAIAAAEQGSHSG